MTQSRTCRASQTSGRAALSWSDASPAAHDGWLSCDSTQLLQKRLRTAVFLREVIPWWLAPVGYGGLAVLSTIFIPMVRAADGPE